MTNSYNLIKNYCLNCDEYKNFTDKELIEFIKEGNIKAEKRLYARYSHVVMVIVSSFFLLGGDKDDLFQEAMIGFVNAVNNYNYNLNTNFRSFAELCIRNQIVSAIRKSGGYEKNLLNNCISIYDMGDDEIGDNRLDKLQDLNCLNPENVFIVKEEVENYREIKSKLLSKLEIAVLDEYEKGKSYEEISVSLEKDVKAIDNALQRIKSKMIKNKDEVMDIY